MRKWTSEQARGYIQALAGLDDYDHEAVVEIIDGMPRELFFELDERPGQFDYDYTNTDWHWKLRRARNSAPGFFEALA